MKISASAAIAVILLAACSSTPSTSPPPPPSAPVAVAPVAPVAATTTPAQLALSAGDELRRAEVAAKANELGYHVEIRNDKRFYCHSEAPLGSRFEKKTCLSEASFAASVRNAQQNTQQPRGACSGAGCMTR